jgi:transcriptional regulator with XRE-family HTH domain
MSQTRLTVRLIANELNVSTGTVSAWRDGRHVSSKHLSQLCDLLQVTESWLLRGKEKQEHLQCDEEFLIHMYRKMTEEQRALITMTSQEFTKSA